MSLAHQIKSAEDSGLDLSAIQIDGGTQSRANLNQSVVDDYAAAIKDGATFPPIVVFYDGKKHWLADGFHRFHAYQKAGRTKVAADIRQGTRRDAILHSVGANETHGLRRTRDDKRRAVLTLLNDAEWSKWSDGEIAKRCAVSREYVNRLRPKDTCDQVTGMERTFIHPKTGEPSTMKMRPAAATAVQEGGDQTEEITSETLPPQDFEGCDEPENAVEEITPSDADLEADLIQSEWDHASDAGRALFLARNNLQFQAKASEDNGATGSDDAEVPSDCMAGEVSRVDAGRTASATSERMDVTAGETAQTSQSTAPTVEAVADQPQAPRRNATATVSVTPPPPGATDETGAAATSPDAAPVTHSDPLDPGPIPDFLRRTA